MNGRDNLMQGVLDNGFAVAARNRDNPALKLIPTPRGETTKRGKGIVHKDKESVIGESLC